MANMTPRGQRVADQIQRELATLIQLEVSDPRVGMVSVTGVDVSRDLAHASVFVTVLEHTERERRGERCAEQSRRSG